MPSKNILQFGNPFKKFISEPDYYIMYRAGYWARWFAMVNAFAAFIIIFSHHKYGHFNTLISSLGVSTFYDIYVSIVDSAGFLAFFVVSYHILWFYRVIGIADPSSSMRTINDISSMTKSQRKSAFYASAVASVICFVVMVFPSASVAIFHEAGIYGYKIHAGGAPEEYENNVIFILIMALITTIVHGICIQGVVCSIVMMESIRRYTEQT